MLSFYLVVDRLNMLAAVLSLRFIFCESYHTSERGGEIV